MNGMNGMGAMSGMGGFGQFPSMGSFGGSQMGMPGQTSPGLQPQNTGGSMDQVSCYSILSSMTISTNAFLSPSSSNNSSNSKR